MDDPTLAIALAGVVLALALTLRFSRPQPVAATGPERARVAASPPAARLDPEVALGRLAALLPAGTSLWTRASPSPSAAPLAIVCDAAMRPLCSIALAAAPPGVAADGAGLPRLDVPPGASRDTVAALLRDAAARAMPEP